MSFFVLIFIDKHKQISHCQTNYHIISILESSDNFN